MMATEPTSCGGGDDTPRAMKSPLVLASVSAPPDRQCYGTTRGIMHIGPCCDWWDSYGMCVCRPVDASSYPTANRLYIAANISPGSNANIRTIFPDGTDDVFYANNSHTYMWVWWDWGGWSGDVRFELRYGTRVVTTRSTHIEGEAPAPVCTEGEKRSPVTCWDGSVIHEEICQNNAWVPSGETCPDEPVDPCEGVVCEPECYGVDKHETVCEEGICIKGVLIKANDPDCGYVPPDPCEGVVCDPECFGVDKHETVCEEGICIKGVLIKANDPDCGYVPPDPCEGVVCVPECTSGHLRNKDCDPNTGECVWGDGRKSHAPECYPPTGSALGRILRLSDLVRISGDRYRCQIDFVNISNSECTYTTLLHSSAGDLIDDGGWIRIQPGAESHRYVIFSRDTDIIDSVLRLATRTGGYQTCEEIPFIPGYVPPDPIPPTVCNEGELRGATICGDGSTIYTEICQNNKWVATSERCPEDPIPPVPDPDPDGIDWTTIALIGAAAVLFYLLIGRL